MKPYPYQVAFADRAYNLLKQHLLVYLAMEERTGKTLVALLACEKCDVQNVLVLTKKKALVGWQETLAKWKHSKVYHVTNYHQAKKCNPANYDLVILDEAHSYISAFPKRSKLWQDVHKLTTHKPIIYVSATPYAQGPQLLYNQLALSDWSPFRNYTTPYTWFKRFGVPDTIWLAGRQVETYKQCKVHEVLSQVNPLFIRATRAQLKFEHEPTDQLHYVKLDSVTRQAYNILLKDKVLMLREKELICDSPIKLRVSLHMLEGGVAKIDSTYIVLNNKEKIQYILEQWGDSVNTVIMYNYIAEKTKLEKVFKQARLLQATSYAEGIDLSMYSNLIIYSQDFSTARHTQRRARQANKERQTPITVHYLLVAKAISEQVYETVSVNKQNFVDSVFERREL